MPDHLVLSILQIATESAIVPDGPNIIASLELLPMTIQANSSLIQAKGTHARRVHDTQQTHQASLYMSSGMNGFAPS